MSTTEKTAELENHINQWRNYLLRRQAIHSVDVAELQPRHWPSNCLPYWVFRLVTRLMAFTSAT